MQYYSTTNKYAERINLAIINLQLIAKLFDGIYLKKDKKCLCLMPIIVRYKIATYYSLENLVQGLSGHSEERRVDVSVNCA